MAYDVGEFSDMFDLSRVSTHSCQIEFHRLGEVSRKVDYLTSWSSMNNML